MGAEPQTLAGLAGMGDLVATCMSPYSRNRTVGELLGRGKPLEEILADMQMVAEGVGTGPNRPGAGGALPGRAADLRGDPQGGHGRATPGRRLPGLRAAGHESDPGSDQARGSDQVAKDSAPRRLPAVAFGPQGAASATRAASTADAQPRPQHGHGQGGSDALAGAEPEVEDGFEPEGGQDGADGPPPGCAARRSGGRRRPAPAPPRPGPPPRWPCRREPPLAPAGGHAEHHAGEHRDLTPAQARPGRPAGRASAPARDRTRARAAAMTARLWRRRMRRIRSRPQPDQRCRVRRRAAPAARAAATVVLPTPTSPTATSPLAGGSAAPAATRRSVSSAVSPSVVTRSPRGSTRPDQVGAGERCSGDSGVDHHHIEAGDSSGHRAHRAARHRGLGDVAGDLGRDRRRRRGR